MTSFSPGQFVRITGAGPYAEMTATLIAEAMFCTDTWWCQLSATDQRVKIEEAEMRPETRGVAVEQRGEVR